MDMHACIVCAQTCLQRIVAVPTDPRHDLPTYRTGSWTPTIAILCTFVALQDNNA